MQYMLHILKKSKLKPYLKSQLPLGAIKKTHEEKTIYKDEPKEINEKIYGEIRRHCLFREKKSH